jgi:hypothetical protein
MCARVACKWFLLCLQSGDLYSTAETATGVLRQTSLISSWTNKLCHIVKTEMSLHSSFCQTTQP